LSDYSRLKENTRPDAKGSLVYFNPEKPLSQYSRFIINPIQFRLIRSEIKYNVRPAELQKFSNYLYQTIKNELEANGYPVVSEPGPETLLLRIAITDLDYFNPVRSSKVLPGMQWVWEGASAEAEIIDALTGEVVVAVVDTQKGKQKAGASQFGPVEEVFNHWAKRLVNRMNEARQ